MLVSVIALGIMHLCMAHPDPSVFSIVSLAERFALPPTENFQDKLVHAAGLHSQLRRLAPVNRNNFIGKTVYSDSGCTNPSQSYGSLVNYCFDRDDADGKSSFLYKMNKKEHTIVQLDYDGYGCRTSIPVKVTDITAAFPEFTDDKEFGDCLMDEYGEYYSVDYLTERPDFMGTYGVLALASVMNAQGGCNTDKFIDFHWYKSGECVKVRTGWGMKFNADDCDSTGAFVASSWPTDSTCTVATAGSYFAEFKECTLFNPSQHDDDTVLANTLFTTVCTY